MEIANQTTSSAITRMGRWVLKPIASQTGYLLCYKRKVKKLEHRVEELEPKKQDIEQKVAEAARRGKVIGHEVNKWLKDFEAIKKDTITMVEGVNGIQRYMGCCWDLSSCYKLGRKADKKIAPIIRLENSVNINILCHEPPPPDFVALHPTSDFIAFPSRKSLMDCVIKAIKNDKNYLIGVYGMPGVGKTCLIEKVAGDTEKKIFDKVILVKVSQNQDIKSIQTEMAQLLGLELRAESQVEWAAKLRTKLKELKKILIILDDLWEVLDLRTVGIPTADENIGCKVVITTRNKEVCRRMESQEQIMVQPLSEEEAWVLFKSKAGDVVERPYLQHVAVDVAKECGRLPLAIVILGSMMRGEDDRKRWYAVLNELRRCISIQGMEVVDICIKRSFDKLSDEAKLCFLFCCLFPEDYEIDIETLCQYVAGERFLSNAYTMKQKRNRVWSILYELKYSCLLLEGKSKLHVMMHDVVRDFAVRIASDETYGFFVGAGEGLRWWPESDRTVEECKRISLMNNRIEILPEETTCPNVQTLMLQYNWKLTISNTFFQGMETLLVLDLRSGISSLPKSLSCLINLRALFLSVDRERFDQSRLSSIGKLKKLQILKLESCHFDGLPEEFGNLTSLMCLDLRSCEGRIQPNLISRMYRLESLYLTGVFSNWQADEESGDKSCATFTELARLACLTTLHVDIANLDIMQQDLTFGPWKTLDDFCITVGVKESRNPETEMSNLPVDLTKIEGRTSLVITKPISSSWVKDLLMKTECLTLHNWSGMNYLIGATEGDIVGHTFSNLFYLRIFRVHDLKALCTGYLPNGSLERLCYLEIQECHKLIYLLPTYSLLIRIHVSRCDKLQNLVKECPNGAVLLQLHLEIIYLEELPELRSIWEGIFVKGSLKNLEKIRVSCCKSLEKNILPPISAVPGTLESFPSLREIEIEGCHSLTNLLSWRHAKGLPHLEYLWVIDCQKMKGVISTEEEEEGETAGGSVLLPQLKEIHLYGLPELRSIWPDGIILLDGSLQNLVKVEVLSCWNLDKNILPPILAAVPHTVESFPSLRTINIWGCHSLTNLFSWKQVKGLLHLESLDVRNCEMMEEVIIFGEEEVVSEEQSVFPHLTNLSLWDLPKLNRIFHGAECPNSLSLKPLTQIEVINCPKLHCLYYEC